MHAAAKAAQSSALPPNAAQTGDPAGLRGGAVLASARLQGKKVREDASVERPHLQQLRLRETQNMRDTYAALSKANYRSLMTVHAPLASSMRPGDRFESLRPIGVEEIVAPVRDQVFWGRALRCVIVSPGSQMSAVYFVVEDERRFPILLALYDLPDAMRDQMVVGRVIVVANPYCRIPTLQSVLGMPAPPPTPSLRVDNAGSTVLVTKDVFLMCTACLSCNPDGMRTCSRCRRAWYCDEACQKRDWVDFSHKMHCNGLVFRVDEDVAPEDQAPRR